MFFKKFLPTHSICLKRQDAGLNLRMMRHQQDGVFAFWCVCGDVYRWPRPVLSRLSRQNNSLPDPWPQFGRATRPTSHSSAARNCRTPKGIQLNESSQQCKSRRIQIGRELASGQIMPVTSAALLPLTLPRALKACVTTLVSRCSSTPTDGQVDVVVNRAFQGVPRPADLKLVPMAPVTRFNRTNPQP